MKKDFVSWGSLLSRCKSTLMSTAHSGLYWLKPFENIISPSTIGPIATVYMHFVSKGQLDLPVLAIRCVLFTFCCNN